MEAYARHFCSVLLLTSKEWLRVNHLIEGDMADKLYTADLFSALLLPWKLRFRWVQLMGDGMAK